MTVTNASMDQLIEIGIIELIDLFRENPAHFKYEIDLCHQFHDILVEKLCEKNDFKIRWELKSITPYKGKQASTDSKYFAQYDISLIQEKSEVVPYAFEFKLFKDLQYDHLDVSYFTPERIRETIDDLNKLTNPDNKVKHGYILTFTYGKISANYRGRIKRHKEKIETFKELINIASTKKNDIKIACVYFSEIGDGLPIFGILQYPDSFCASVNQKERFS